MCILIWNCQPKRNSTCGAYRITDYNSFFTRLFFQQPPEIIFSTIFHQLRVGLCIYNASPTQVVSSTKYCSIKIHLLSFMFRHTKSNLLFISYKALPIFLLVCFLILNSSQSSVVQEGQQTQLSLPNWPYSSSAVPLTFYLGRQSPTKTSCISVRQRFFF